MATLAIDVGNVSLSYNLTDVAQLAALDAVRTNHNSRIMVPAGESVEDQDSYCADNSAYMNFALDLWARNNNVDVTSVTETIERALASYAGQEPPEVVVQVEAPTVDALLAYAADRRWRKEVGGIVVAGMPVPTDDRAKLLIMGAAQSMADADTAPFVVGGMSVTLTGAQFKGIYAAIVAHVAACFGLQQTAIAGITANPPTITDKAGVESVFA